MITRDLIQDNYQHALLAYCHAPSTHGKKNLLLDEIDALSPEQITEVSQQYETRLSTLISMLDHHQLLKQNISLVHALIKRSQLLDAISRKPQYLT